MRHKTLLFIILLFSVSVSFADEPMDTNERLIYENDDYFFYHRFDWQHCNVDYLKAKKYDQNPDFFCKENDYGSLICIKKKTEKTLFEIPMSPLDLLWISKDAKYIIGLSDVKELNPNQLVILNLKGKILFTKSISSDCAKLKPEEYKDFLKKFKVTKFPERDIIYKNGFLYINYTPISLSGKLPEKAVDFLISKNKKSVLSKNFRETVSNFIIWYHFPFPDIKIKKNKSGDITEISLLDPKKERITIQVKLEKAHDNNLKQEYWNSVFILNKIKPGISQEYLFEVMKEKYKDTGYVYWGGTGRYTIYFLIDNSTQIKFTFDKDKKLLEKPYLLNKSDWKKNSEGVLISSEP